MSRPVDETILPEKTDLGRVHVAVNNNDTEFLGGLGPSEAARILRKVDYHLMPCLICLYLISFIDRGTLANASILGLKEDLGLDSVKYNLVATVFLFTYAAFEIPSNWVLQKVRPNRWIAIICFTWGFVTIMSGLVQNYAGAICVRLALGVAEAGFFPAAVFLTSVWYPRKNVQWRISIFYCMGSLSGSFTGLIAYGVAHMDGVANLASWRWIFILEGLVTVAFAPLVIYIMPNSPEASKWLTPSEKEWLASVCAAGGAQSPHVPFKKTYLMAAVKDYKVWLGAWLGMGGNIALYGFSYTLPTILLELGYKAETAQLMTVPIYAVGAFWTLCCAFVSDKIRRRAPNIIINLSISFAGLLVEFLLPKTTDFVHARYGALFLIPMGIYGAYPGTLSWITNNTAGRGKRAMASALQLTLANLSAAIGTNIYLGREAPKYPTGFSVSLVVQGTGVLAALLMWYLLARENATRAKLTTADIQQMYTEAELESMGDKAPTFRYIL